MSEQVSTAALVEKLAGWVEQQPEYPMLFAADRALRRRAARIVAYRLMVLPTVPASGPNRAERRAARERVATMVGDFKTKLSKRQQRLAREQQKMRDRYARLSAARIQELVDRAYSDAYETNAKYDKLAAAADDLSPVAEQEGAAE